MARDDWIQIYLPVEMHSKLKKISEMPEMRAKGFTNPKEIVLEIVRRWLAENNVE